jgi:DNA-directed RNA polymerase subunit H (RpoH/RPB5)
MDNSTIINVLQNVYKMLENRGFDMTKVNRNPPTAHLDHLIKLFRDRKNTLDIMIENDNQDKPNFGKKVYVHFIHNLRNAKSNKEFEELYDVVTKAHNMMEKDHIIIVVFDDLTEKHRSLEVEFPNLTLFTYKNLMFNIVDHEFVPHHECLTAAEKIKLLSDFMIKDYNKLPLISKFDPVCRYYNFKIGDVLRITRPSDANKTYVSYRYVQLLD